VRVCVTGATGFLGRRIVARLAAERHEVTALVLPRDDAAVVAGSGARVVRGDVADPVAAREAIAGAEVVFHAAGLVPARARNRRELLRTNVDGARVVAEAAVRAGVRRLVHCSSAGVYGVPAHPPVDERTPPAPVNAYQASKLAGEHAVARVVAGGATSAVVARLTALYGDGDRGTLPLFRAVVRGRVRVIGDGSVPCQLTHVDDAAALLRACADWCRADGAAHLLVVGSAERTTVRGLVELIARAAGVDPRVTALPATPLAVAWRLHRAVARRLTPWPGRIDGLDFFLADRSVDVSLATRELGVVARVELADGIRDAVAHARAAGLLGAA
jgi:nucleoside-diphosphate-sugar epimerase